CSTTPDAGRHHRTCSPQVTPATATYNNGRAHRTCSPQVTPATATYKNAGRAFAVAPRWIGCASMQLGSDHQAGGPVVPGPTRPHAGVRAGTTGTGTQRPEVTP